jgi:NAD(P)-dependent dehydrogenase (short-subunit alcohol dehydrogenase family)
VPKVANYLIFGASGSIGSACAEKIRLSGSVINGSRDSIELVQQVEMISEFDGVVWAQGINSADSAIDFNRDSYENVMDANVSFILDSLKLLLDAGKLSRNSQLVILSSVWGRVSRPNKLSYGISKAALGGLVRSLAVDLGPTGIQVNAVSPGPVDTPMTIKNLNPEELGRVISEVPLKRLVTLDEVTSLIYELVTGKLSGVNGQEIVVDGGWSVSKLV